MAKRFIRKLTRVAKYSYALILPARVVKEFRWRERQRLLVRVRHRAKRLVIEDYVPRRRGK